MDPTLIFPNCYVHLQLTRLLSACKFLELSYSQWKRVGAVELERVVLQGEASFALKVFQQKNHLGLDFWGSRCSETEALSTSKFHMTPNEASTTFDSPEFSNFIE